MVGNWDGSRCVSLLALLFRGEECEVGERVFVNVSPVNFAASRCTTVHRSDAPRRPFRKLKHVSAAALRDARARARVRPPAFSRRRNNAPQSKRYNHPQGTNQPKQTRISASRIRGRRSAPPTRANFFASTSTRVNLINRRRNARTSRAAPPSRTSPLPPWCHHVSRGFFIYAQPAE